MHQKNIIAYRHRNKWQKLKVPFRPRETSYKNILSAVDCNVRLNSLTQRISAVEERIISFIEDATWSRECQYYTPGTSTRNPSSVQTLFWKPFGHSRTKKVAPRTPVPEWKGTGRTLKATSVFIKYNTQILGPCKELSQCCSPVRGGQEKCLHKEDKATEKAEVSITAGGKEEESKTKPTKPKTNHNTIDDERKMRRAIL